MKTWTPAGAVLFFCSMAAGQPSTYNITVKIAGGNIDYGHVMGTHGAHGHQIAAQNDVINWACDSTCTLVAITFKGNSPCASPGLLVWLPSVVPAYSPTAWQWSIQEDTQS